MLGIKEVGGDLPALQWGTSYVSKITTPLNGGHHLIH
jgi:hypothetical protein